MRDTQNAEVGRVKSSEGFFFKCPQKYLFCCLEIYIFLIDADQLSCLAFDIIYL